MSAVEAVLERLDRVKRNGTGWTARCPAHDDRKPSLSVSEGDDGRVLLHCQAGCTIEQVLAAAGLEQRHLFAQSNGQAPRIVATYDYVDEAGELLYQAVRREPKDFQQRRPDGNGGWTWSLGDTRRVLYRLPDVTEALGLTAPIYVVEGEKDVEAVERAGGVATCNPMGAGKWRPEYAEQLRGANVIVVRDLDDAGRAHAEQVRASLDGVAATVTVVDPAAGKDAADHLAAGYGLDDFDPPEPGEPGGELPGPTAAATDAPRLSLRGLDTYRVRRVEWLDKPFLQRSVFVLLAGRKGSCKGTYLCGISARISRGDLYGEPKRVLVITSEDSVELDFLPRVLAAGGDTEKIKIVNGPFRMPADLPWLEQEARELGDTGLIVIDPIGNHLGGADTDKEGLVREAISPLNPIADTLDCLIVGVRHLGKDVSRGALSSVLGSTAWVDVPRSVILMAVDDEDDRLFHAQVVAGNRGPRNSGRAFRLELVDVPPATEITLAVPEGESRKSVEDLLGARDRAPASRSSAASDLILDILEREGAQESDALDARVAQETGIAAKTVRNLRGKLKTDGLVNAHPQKDANGTVLRWIVARTLAPRDNHSPTHPNTNPENWLNQATARPEPLESVSTGTGQPQPDSTERGSGVDDDEIERLRDLAENAAAEPGSNGSGATREDAAREVSA